MESTEKNQYQVAITSPAEAGFYEVLDYLYCHYSIDRAEQLANEIRDTTRNLCYHPERGNLEPRLSQRSQKYCYILFRRTVRATII